MQLVLGAIVGSILGVLASALVAFWWPPRYGWLALPLCLGALGFLLLILFLVWLEKPAKPLTKLASGIAPILVFWVCCWWLLSPDVLLIRAVEPDVALPGEEIKVTASGFDADQKEAYNVQLESTPLDFRLGSIAPDEVTLILQLPTDRTPLDENELGVSLDLTGPWPSEDKTTVRLLGRPVIKSITPPEGYRTKGNENGTAVQIVGKNFRPGKTRVFFGATESRAVEVEDFQHVVTTVPDVPRSGRRYDVLVRVGQVESDPMRFDVFDSPIIDSIRPTEAFAATRVYTGTVLTIRGSNLGSELEPSRTEVVIGNVRVAHIDQVQSNEIITRVPLGVSDGTIIVKTPENNTEYKVPIRIVTEEPMIKSIQPAAQIPQEPIDIIGRYFDCTDPANNTVWFGFVSAKARSCEDADPEQVLKVIVPSTARDSQVSVETSVGRSDRSLFFAVIPTIKIPGGVDPGAGRPGDPIVISGFGLTEDTQVSFAQRSAAIIGRRLDMLPQEVHVRVPDAITDSPVCVLNPHGQNCTRDNFLVRGTDDNVIRRLPGRIARYQGTSVIIEFETDCAKNLIHYKLREVTTDSWEENTFDPRGSCPIDLYVDESERILYVVNYGSDSVTRFNLPYLNFMEPPIKTQVGPLRMEMVLGKVHIINQFGQYRIYASDVSYKQFDVGQNVLDIWWDKERIFVLGGGTDAEPGFVAEVDENDGVVGRSEFAGRINRYAKEPNKIYVTNFDSDSVSVFDSVTRNITEIPIGEMSKPFGLAMDHGRQKLFVTANGTSEVVVIHTNGDYIGDRITANREPRGIAISKSACIILVVGASVDGKGSLLAINPETHSAEGEPWILRDPAASLSDVRFEGDEFAYVRKGSGEEARGGEDAVYVQARVGCGAPIPRLKP